MNYDDVLRIRNAQNSMRKRFEDAKLATTEEIAEMVQTETARQIGSPRVTEIEAMIFRMRTELIDYIVAHGLVDGWTMDGALQPVENGKIPLTSELLQDVVSKMGYLTEDQIKAFLERFLPENHYVSDGNYVHTDNNFTDGYETKLDGIENGAEVNLVNDVTLDGKSVLVNKVASLTAESIKKSYESNSNTNAFTDADKAKLAGIADGAEKNRVDDVLVNGRSVLNENKKAVISKEIVKQAYESNPNTNAFTDNEKSKLEGIASGAEVNLVNDVTLDGKSILVDKIARLTASAIKTSYESNPDTNALTDAEKQAIADNTAKGEANAGAIDRISQEIVAIQNELTPEAIKLTYESNPDTNAFTDNEKSKLEGIASGAEVNLVNDVTLDGVTLVENKVAKLTAAKVKSAYESNPNTNAFSDSDKTALDKMFSNRRTLFYSEIVTKSTPYKRADAYQEGMKELHYIEASVALDYNYNGQPTSNQYTVSGILYYYKEDNLSPLIGGQTTIFLNSAQLRGLEKYVSLEVAVGSDGKVKGNYVTVAFDLSASDTLDSLVCKVIINRDKRIN